MTWHRRATLWTSGHKHVIDAVIIVVVGAFALLSTALLSPKGSEQQADWVAYALALIGPATLWWRRSKPLITLPLATAAVIFYWVADYAGATDLVLWVAFFSATRHGGTDRHRVWQVVGLALLAVVAVTTVGVIVPSEDLPLISVFGILFIHSTAALTGEALYQRSQYVSELEQRAATLEADLNNKAALAAVEERTRIAREMHDIIAHGMSSVVVQAQAGQRVIESDPAKARQVLTTIETIGRDSVNEMRRMLGVLRDGDSDPTFEPQPSLDNLDDLLDDAKEAGVTMAITTTGQHRPLPPGLELTGYRVVQEALTNIIRHAGRPVTAEAAVVYGDDAVEITVTDDGLGAAAQPATAGTGHGLLGMRERVEIYHGQFAAGPRPGGGYEVAATLPTPTTPNKVSKVNA